jgi:hypothetical protein
MSQVETEVTMPRTQAPCCCSGAQVTTPPTKAPCCAGPQVTTPPTKAPCCAGPQSEGAQ